MRTLFVVPTTDLADEITSAQATPGAGALATRLGRAAVTLRNLEEELARGATNGRRTISPAMRALAIDHVLATLPSAATLPFAKVLARRGFRHAVERHLAEVAASGLGFTHLARVANALAPALRERVKSLARIGLEYLALLDEHGLVDPSFALAEARAALDEGGALPSLLSGVDRLVFRGIVDWTPGRLALAGTLAQAGARAGMKVVVELPQSARAEVADALDPAWRELEKRGGELELIGVPIELPLADRVQGFGAANQRAEARELAERVAALVAAGTPPERIAVATRSLRDVADSLHDALARCGVPARNRLGTRLADTAVARLAGELAELDRSRTTRERVAAIVGSRLVDLRGLEAEAPPPATIVRHLRAAAVRDRTRTAAGDDGFASQLERLARSVERSPEESDRVRRTGSTLVKLFARLDAWPRDAAPGVHARTLLTLLDDLRVPNRLRRLAFRDLEGRESIPDGTEVAQSAALALEQAAWQRLTDVVGELVDAHRALGLDRRPLSRADFAAWVGELVRADTIRPGGARGAAVELLELGDVALRSFDHVFVAGVYDGLLPGPPDTDPLLAEDERWALNDALGRPAFRVSHGAAQSSPLPARQLLQAASFALALASANQSVTLSRPRGDVRGRPLAPSPLASLVPVAWTDVRFEPLDPRLGARTDEGIEQRRAAARERLQASVDPSAAGAWSGDLSPIAATLAPHQAGSPERPLSPKALETLASCAFRHFATALLRVSEDDEPTDEAGPLELGRAGHLAAEHAVRAIVERDLWRLDRRDEAIATGLAAASTALANVEPATVVGHPELWEIARSRLLGRLGHLIERELAHAAETGLVPALFEAPFGPDHEIPSLELSGIHVQGKIDRVDRGAGALEIVDYKSGGTSGNAGKLGKARLLATELQLPIYVAALRAKETEMKVDARYVSLRDGKRTKALSQALAAMGAADDALESRVGELVGTLRSARWPVAPRSCSNCSLRPTCRIPRAV